MLTEPRKVCSHPIFFCKGPKPSVIAQMKQRGRELGNWGGLFDKAIDAKANSRLQTPLHHPGDGSRCPRGNRPAHTSQGKSQASLSRDPRDKSFEALTTLTQKRRDKPFERAQAHDKPRPLYPLSSLHSHSLR